MTQIESEHLLHFAGLEGGRSPIDWIDKWNASSAQKHPVGNAVFSTIAGWLAATSTTALGVLAYPLLNSASRVTIIGDSSTVCLACVASIKGLSNKALSINAALGNPLEAGTINSWVGPSVLGLSKGVQCSLDLGNEIVNSCRANNFLAAATDVVSENILLVGGIALALFGAAYCKGISNCEAQEAETEERLIRKLKTTYQMAADQLKAKTSDLSVNNKEVSKLASAILANRVTINKEVDALRLPSLTIREVHKITEPLFKAAKKVQKQR